MANPGPDWVAEGHCGLLEVKQNATGALVGDAMVDEGGDDLVERGLDVGNRFHAREARAEDVGAANDGGGILATFVIAVVVVTEFLATKGGRAARDAIMLEIGARRKDMGPPRKAISN